MATIADSTRVTPPLVAFAGQTDFPCAFPAGMVDGAPGGIDGLRVRGGVETQLDPAHDFALTDASDAGFTVRLTVGAQAADVYVFYGALPGDRPRSQPDNGLAQTSVIEADMLQVITTLQEHARDLARALKLSLLGGYFDAGGLPILNLGASTDATAAVTFAQLEAFGGGGGGGGGGGAGDWSTLANRPANLLALAALAGAAGKIVEFTGPGAMHLIDTPSGGAASWAALSGRPANLTAIAALAGAAGKIIEFTGAGTVHLVDTPPAGTTLLTAIKDLAPATGKIIEFTGPTAAHLIDTPSGAGGFSAATDFSVFPSYPDAASAVAGGLSSGQAYFNGDVLQRVP